MKKFIAPFIVILFGIIIIPSCTKTDLNNSTLTAINQNSKTVNPNVLQCGNGYQWDYYLKKCVPVCASGYHNDSITGACVVNGGGTGITISYAGVNITYFSNNHILSFNSASDVNTVLNQLDADYENYNAAYENQYTNYTALQLDSLDSVNNFDELRTYRDFEGQFAGYTSERSVFENNETSWLNNNMTGADPDSLDYTSDNSENAICNSNYNLIIAGTTYQWTPSGLIVGGGIIESIASPAAINCFSNYKIAKYYYSSDQSRRCKFKVAVNDCLIRGSAKAKVKSFRKKSNGKWVHSRMNMKVNLQGTFFTTNCSQWVTITENKGYLKRRELKYVNRQNSGYGYTESGYFQGSFYTDASGLSATIVLQ